MVLPDYRFVLLLIQFSNSFIISYVVLISLFKSVSFDVSQVFKDNFLQSLLVHIRSTNKIIQMDAAELLNILIKKSSKKEVVMDIVKDILQTLTGGQYLFNFYFNIANLLYTLNELLT